MPELYNIKYTSRVEDDRIKIVTVMWTIPNFTALLENQIHNDLFTEKLDCVSKDEDAKFQLKMQFVGKETDLIEIYYLAPVPMFLKSILTICLKCYKERSIVMKDYHIVQPYRWQFLGALFKRDIISLDSCANFLDEGTLSLKFQFMINREIKVDLSNMPKAELSHDLLGLLKSPTFSDVTLKSVEGLEFPCHKAVLASRSPVLKAHFEHNTKECQTNVIETHWDNELLQEILTYIYTDYTEKVYEMPHKLLAAADFYQMNRLKRLCGEALHQSLTVENAIDTLQLAELHSATYLRYMTLEYISDGHIKLIMKTNSWAKLESIPLIKIIFEHIYLCGPQESEDLR